MIKAAINGFGRIGALFTRAYLENWRGKFKLVAINASGTSGNMTSKEVAHRLKYDSNYGVLGEEIAAFPDSVVYFPRGEGVENVGDGGRIKILGEPDAEKLPWKELGVDIVIDCTGEMLTAEKAEKHLKAGAKTVILSAPPKDENISMFVYGVNHCNYRPEMKIISNASCTTNALAPLVKVISENWKIIAAPFSTIHAFTGDQRLTDGKHKDPRRSRRALDNVIPTKTNADKNIAKIFPDLKGKTQGLAYRVATSTVSIVDAVFFLQGAIEKEELVAAIKKAAAGGLKGVLGWSDEELVSSDFKKDSRSAIVDLPAVRIETSEIIVKPDIEIDAELSAEEEEIDRQFYHLVEKAINQLEIPYAMTIARIPIWYDNEWAYACRLGDLLNYAISKM